MNKKILIGILAVVLVCTLAGAIVFNMMSSNEEVKENESEEIEQLRSDGASILVVYYSATGSTENVANIIASELDADIFEIVPTEIYTSDDLNWSNSESRVTREHEDESLRDVELETTIVSNFEDYDIVLIGYPIWWGIAAWPVNNFVIENDFTGKTVIPFCTSASSGIGESGVLLEEMAYSGNWQSGVRFSSGASEDEIVTWLEEMNLM